MAKKTITISRNRPSAKEQAIEAVKQVENIPLTEEQHLVNLEQIIEKNFQAFYEVGRALQEIRDQKLYKVYGYNKFEDYCTERWDMHRDYAYKTIAATEVVENLYTMEYILPVSERQVRPLTRLSPEEQRQVWEKVIETAPVVKDKPKITTKLVEETIATVIGTPEKPPKEKKAGVKNTFYLSEETDDALNEAFYRVRQLAGKERKKLSKEAVIEVLLQMALEGLEEKEGIVVEKALPKTT